MWSVLHVFPDSPFVLMNKATGFCIVKRSTRCLDVRWTSNNRLFVTSTKKCLGTQGKTVGSEVSTFDCDDKNDLQKWECKNETLLALKGQNLYVEVRADDTMALSRTVGPNNQLTITGTSSGACSRTHRGRVRKPLIEPNGAGENAAFWTENFPLHFTYVWLLLPPANEHVLWNACRHSSYLIYVKGDMHCLTEEQWFWIYLTEKMYSMQLICNSSPLLGSSTTLQIYPISHLCDEKHSPTQYTHYLQISMILFVCT